LKGSGWHFEHPLKGEAKVAPRISLLLLLLTLASVLGDRADRRPDRENPLPPEAAVSNMIAAGDDDRQNLEQLSPYPFDRRANALLSIIFPRIVYPSGYAKAYLQRARTMEFASRDEALQYHAGSVNAGSTAAEPYARAKEATESFWRSAHPKDGRSRKLLKDVYRVEHFARGMAGDYSKPKDLLERALWQRDLVCSLQAILHCEATEEDSHSKTDWKGAKDALLECLKQVVFCEADFLELETRFPAPLGSGHFISTCRCELTDDYLPPVVWGPSANWHELPSDEEPGLHYQAYGGRDFTRVFMMIPDTSEAAFFEYWEKVTRRFGMKVTVSAAVPPLPSGTQTVLLRTFGVFLDDGSYADSRIPEEVLVRVFKYRQATLDPKTSDGLGTLHYQYKLRRDRLLKDPTTLGLCRIYDADGQFYGFFADVPEPNSTEHLTTMRANCISCHSELLYGASTIFSLCRRSPAKPNPPRVEGGCLERMGSKGWLVRQEGLGTIQKELISRLKAPR
jgi:hypothetical protein